MADEDDLAGEQGFQAEIRAGEEGLQEGPLWGGMGRRRRRCQRALLLAGGGLFLGSRFRGHGSSTVGYVLGWFEGSVHSRYQWNRVRIRLSSIEGAEVY